MNEILCDVCNCSYSDPYYDGMASRNGVFLYICQDCAEEILEEKIPTFAIDDTK